MAGRKYAEDLWTHYNNNPVEKLSGPSTGEQYGRGAAQPYYRHVVNFALGPYNNAGARVLTYGAAAPTTGAHAAGEIVFNNGATSTTAVAWQCVATGTPGTWRAIFSGFGIAPVGYSTGAGGAVTQATAKSTGVTLNKLSGQVTMNAGSLAAGAAAGFTLTNSQIAASDIVKVNIASGASADSYVVGVDAVAAGSCRISLRNLSAGALAEAVVLNFAVIKAVAA
ncbi:hypothetical protein [Sphingomonas sp.]|uniref:hypothetical protein n=1 Tax=Sphingomonas sp. TaxID=28214 RepID=UPI0025CCD53E|nr:hypothetical protein [Sphingomonas sp.]MBV9529245.1 hypothetical protein [Sphingomonas sp.]